jgi:AraC family L-rhamnose operon transcriptional activator RhaR
MEIAIITEGTGFHFSSVGRQRIVEGDVFVLRPGAWHSFEDCQDLKVYNCCFGTELLSQELGWVRQIPGINYLLWRGPLNSQAPGILKFTLSKTAIEYCREYLSKIEEILAVKPDQQKAALLGLLLVVLSELSTRANIEGLSDNPDQASALPEAVLKAANLLESEVARDWTLPELAGLLHLNPAYFVRLFKKHTGLSPMAYLNHQRAERAANLLVETQKPIAEIAQEVGWADQNYFARCFKSHFGMSGKVYRSKYRRK